MTAYAKHNKLKVYCCAVVTTTLFVLLLQVFAGVHA